MAWFDEFNLPGATIDGYFGFISADGPDDDDYPDVVLANGTVTFTATTPAARVDGAWLGIESVTAQIFEGRIVISEEDVRPVRLLATDAPIGVADWAWKATFQVEGFKLDPLTFKAPRDTTVNLTADLIPIKSQPYQIIEGASIVDAEVDDAGRMRFEMSDGTFTQWVDVPNGEQGIQGERGEKGDPGKDGTAATLAMGTVTAGTTADAWMTGTPLARELHLTLPRGIKGEKGEDATPPTIEWDGSVLKVDGKASPDLKGTSGIASITTPRSGVWMIDQAGGDDGDTLADLQQAVYGKAEQTDLDALSDTSDQLADDVAGVTVELGGVTGRLAAAEQRLGAEPVAVTFVNNSTPSIPNRTNVIPSGWEQVGDGNSAITAADGKFTTAQPGVYLVSLSGSYGNGTVSGNYEYRVLLNGGRVLAFYGAGDVSSRSGACALQLGAGDSIEIEFYQTSGETFSLRGNSFNTVTFTRIA